MAKAGSNRHHLESNSKQGDQFHSHYVENALPALNPNYCCCPENDCDESGISPVFVMAESSPLIWPGSEPERISGSLVQSLGPNLNDGRRLELILISPIGSTSHDPGRTLRHEPSPVYVPDAEISKLMLPPRPDTRAKTLMLHLLRQAEDRGLSARGLARTISDLGISDAQKIGRDKVGLLLSELERENCVIRKAKRGKDAAWVHADYKGLILPKTSED